MSFFLCKFRSFSRLLISNRKNLDDGRGGVSSSNGQRFEPPNRVQVNRPNSPTQSHSHSHALSREVLSDQQSVPIAESWCITKVKRLKFQCLLFVGKFLFSNFIDINEIEKRWFELEILTQKLTDLTKRKSQIKAIFIQG